MDEDLDIDAPVKSAPKQGRRAKLSLRASKNKSPQDIEGEINAPSKATDTPTKPSRRQTGWDMSSASAADDLFDSRLLPDDHRSSDEEIPVIPDLDELHDDDIIQEVAAPPSVTAANMASFQELDMELMNKSAFRTLDGNIDLKALVKNLASEKEVREERDVQWEWDKLFADVSANLKAKPDAATVVYNTTQERSV